MKTYFADTNFYLRFILKDNQNQTKKARGLFQKAQEGKIKIVFLPQVIFEMEFVLRSFYSLSKEEIVKYLFPLIKTKYFEVKERDIWMMTFEIFQKKNVSIFDIFLFLKAKKEKAEVLSFDKDFRKLQKLSL